MSYLRLIEICSIEGVFFFFLHPFLSLSFLFLSPTTSFSPFSIPFPLPLLPFLSLFLPPSLPSSSISIAYSPSLLPQLFFLSLVFLPLHTNSLPPIFSKSSTSPFHSIFHSSSTLFLFLPLYPTLLTNLFFSST